MFCSPSDAQSFCKKITLTSASACAPFGGPIPKWNTLTKWNMPHTENTDTPISQHKNTILFSRVSQRRASTAPTAAPAQAQGWVYRIIYTPELTEMHSVPLPTQFI